MKCVTCGKDAAVGYYCADHIPGTSTMNRAERKDDKTQETDTKKKGNNDD